MKHFYSFIAIFALIISLFPTTQVAEAAIACPLNFGADDIRIDLDQTKVFANQSPRKVATHGVDIPNGRFEVQVATYSNRGANANKQKYESVKLSFRNGPNVVKTTRATDDINNNNPMKISNVGSATLFQDVTNVLVEHAYPGNSTGYNEGVKAVCVRLRPIILINDELQATCSPSKDTIKEDEEVTWTADVSGGTGNYTYQWGNGDTGQSITDSYPGSGSYTQAVVVSDGSNTTTATCDVTIEDDDDNGGGSGNGGTLEASCEVSDATIREGDIVEFEADVTGGQGDYDYDWDWDIDGDSRTERFRFNQEGVYEVRLTVRDEAGGMSVDVCPLIRVDNDYDDNDDDNDELDVQCTVSDTRVREGEIVEYEVDIDDGNAPYDIEWTGDVDGDDERERVRFNRPGTYEAGVIVEDDDGERKRVRCPIVRVDDYNNYYSGSHNGSQGSYTASQGTFYNLANLFGGNAPQQYTNTTGYGYNANANGIYLSQVPYTGPADVLKVAGILAFALILGVAGARQLRKRKSTTQVASRINSFKEANKAAIKIS